jgi:hypothetical protein
LHRVWSVRTLNANRADKKKSEEKKLLSIKLSEIIK